MENEAQQQAGNQFVVIETHLQVSNLVKILLTIPFDILKDSVETVPSEMKDTQHARVLAATYKFYTEVINSATPPEAAQESAASEEGVL